jgi:predicted MFS family arabinose efflux permease
LSRTPPVATDPATAGDWPAARRLFVLTVLCVVAAINLIDRQLITILLEPIKREFKVSDTKMGLLTGLSFAFVYVTAALPIARWSDRGMRRNIIATCILIWGTMTMLCGVAHSYFQLAAARMGVAFGEAGYNPAAHSMIADLYPLARRGAAIGMFNAAASVGIGFGLFFGGWLNTHFGWRAVFVIVGAPCILVALFIRLAVREPPRGLSDIVATQGSPPPLRETIEWLVRLRTFRYLAFSAMTCAFVNYGMQIWAASFFLRIHGLDAKEVGLKLGVASASGLFVGTILSGALADRFGQVDVRWYMRVTGIGMLLTVPFGALALQSTSADPAFGYYCVTIGFLSSWASPIHAMTQTLAAARMRGMASAIIGFCLNLVGFGLGPLFVGILNDHFTPTQGSQSLRISLMILLSGCLVAAYVCFSTNRSMNEDLVFSRSGAAGRVWRGRDVVPLKQKDSQCVP